MNHFTYLPLAALLTVSAGTVHAQSQLRNPGFEGEWNKYTNNVIPTNPDGSMAGDAVPTDVYEPKGWHSFPTAIGSFAVAAQSAIKLTESADVRPGSVGTKSAKICSNMVLGFIAANGNLTTGKISAASMTPTDAEGNYNFTDLSDSDFSNPFTAKPDSMTVWVKFIPETATDKARVNVVLHDNFQYQDPAATDEIAAHVVASAELNYPSTEGKWVKYSIPFVYNEKNTQPSVYALVSFSTSETPGGGTGSDTVYVDDVNMVYNSKLAGISLNGTPLGTFSKEKMSYVVVGQYADGILSTVADGVGATVKTTYDAVSSIATIRVEGADFEDNATNFHEYTVAFKEVTDISNRYDGKLVVTINGESTPAANEFVTIETNEDRTLATFTLKNFYLDMGDGEKTGVGTINITDIPMVVEGNQIKLVAEKNIKIEPGTDPDEYWLGPDLPEIPMVLDATVEGDKLDVDINISVLGLDIKVKFLSEASIIESVDEQTMDQNKLRVYTIDRTTLGVEGVEEGQLFSIYSGSGMEVMTGKIGGTINIEGLSHGLYLMKVDGSVIKFLR